jgi:DNA-directed RNA polymerase subunit M/transcription elongation factor TFIIS
MNSIVFVFDSKIELNNIGLIHTATIKPRPEIIDTMHFCTGCGNMYYIRLTEDNTIVYYCRNCGNEDNAITIDNLVVSHTSLRQTGVNQSNGVNKYTKLDPTLPRISTIQCPNSDCPCNRNHNPTQYADRATILGTTAEESASSAGAASSEPDDTVPREVIYLRYDDIRLKYIYLCAVCNTIWNTDRI